MMSGTMQEFNLVSIHEARKSIDMSLSIKRLTWITVSPNAKFLARVLMRP